MLVKLFGMIFFHASEVVWYDFFHACEVVWYDLFILVELFGI